MQDRIKELLAQAEKLLRDADEDLGTPNRTREQRESARRRRNALNAACNALWRAERA